MNGTIPPEMLTELQRQDEHLKRLPTDFEYPLFSGRQAVESQRKSGYKTTAHAARELVDNSIEAGAKNIWFALERVGLSARKKHQRKETLSAIAVIDDGPGMRPQLARYALSWGGGTHTDNPNFIAKFGFGLPNSSINQTRRVEVYTKTVEDADWCCVVLDINEVPQHGLMKIPAPVSAKLPSFVEEYLRGKEVELPSGTVIVWQRPDRLTYSQATQLKQHLRHDFGIVYRNLLEKVVIHIEESVVKKVDPFFLSPDGMFYVPPAENGAQCTFDRMLVTKFTRDEETGTPNLKVLESVEEIDAARSESGATVGTIQVRMARFPYGFVRGEKKYQGTDEYKRFEIRKSRRGISFVRAGREIDTLDIFPTTETDKASGLGDWPILQAYALHWGIEVRFSPELDEAFGIGNDKQTVRPIGDFWRVMSAVEVDRAARVEDRHQREIRKKEKANQAVEEASSPDKPNPATEAAAQAEEIGRYQRFPEERKQEAQKQTEKKVQEQVKTTGATADEAKKVIEEEARRKRYAIKFFESEGGAFYKPDFGNGLQRVVMVNKAHPFFDLLYARLAKLKDPRPRQAVDLLLLALAQAELRSDGIKRTCYENEREREWSYFLGNGLKILEQFTYEMEDDTEDL